MTARSASPSCARRTRGFSPGRAASPTIISLPSQAYAAILRSPHAHARIVSLDTSRAARLPGVLTVLTGRDYVAEGLKPLPHGPEGADHLDVKKPAFGPEAMPGGPPPLQPPLAIDRVRFVGEAVAIVVAEPRSTPPATRSNRSRLLTRRSAP